MPLLAGLGKTVRPMEVQLLHHGSELEPSLYFLLLLLLSTLSPLLHYTCSTLSASPFHFTLVRLPALGNIFNKSNFHKRLAGWSLATRGGEQSRTVVHLCTCKLETGFTSQTQLTPNSKLQFNRTIHHVSLPLFAGHWFGDHFTWLARKTRI